MRPHISIFVTDVAKTAEFYSKVFNEKPQKQTSDYAKFDLKSPSLNFSFMSREDGKVSRVSHLGIEVDSADDVLNWKEKLTNSGVMSRDEMATECCYAEQDKIWFSDPDGNEWEVFYVKKQLDIPTVKTKTTCDPKSGCCP